MMLDFTQWTRADWQAFDEARRIAFEPTPEEIAEREAGYLNQLISTASFFLLKYGIKLTGQELDFSELYRSYIKGNGTQNNYAMYEWLGDDERLDEVIAYRIEHHNNIKDFCQFIIQYEQ